LSFYRVLFIIFVFQNYKIMTDKFSTIPLKRLFLIFQNHENLSSFGLTKDLFYKCNPRIKSHFISQQISTPFGVAAGPHTQMAQNIIMAWLSGARYIELKTVQILDELEVSKPCIDMADEGYNCEWSQELKLHESYNEYLNAWIMLHIFNHQLNPDKNIDTIFNMSVGYNLEGIKSEKVQWFLNKMRDCSHEKEQKIKELHEIYPEILNISIPNCISDNVTISTMHGCPPDEIEKIARYLIEEKKLNTILKLNPTLLGKDDLRDILNKKLLFNTIVPDEAFKHDIKYPQAIQIIQKLLKTAEKNNVFFGIKLTNTLECKNIKNVFSPEQQSMYMSGVALHPISINLANKIRKTFNGNIPISFSAGCDCFNISEVLSCGLHPVTVSSDILKPGGYSRLLQYAEEIEKSFLAHNASSLNEFIAHTANNINNVTEAALINLEHYAQRVLNDKRYKKEVLFEKNIKTKRKLSYFDCIAAPCTYTCPTNQDIPEYMYHASKADFKEAFKTILRTNPFPHVLGMVCDHKCQTKCTRINYDEDLRIRDVKWYISENNNNQITDVSPLNGLKVAVIGAGPSGLSCAYFLRLAGVDVTVYESKNMSGGMISEAIPHFRLKEKALNIDIERIKKLGVHVHYNAKINKKSFEIIKDEYNFIYIAVGAQKIKKLGIEGENASGVLCPIEFLSAIKKKNLDFKGSNIVVIGGGNTAMDVARAVLRLVKDNQKVTLIYRRTISEMPAEKEEIEALLSEGIQVKELTQPVAVVTENNKVIALRCVKMKLKQKDTSGRAGVEPIENSLFDIPADTVIPALGQEINIDFMDKEDVQLILSGENEFNNIFIGGDAYRGGSTIVNAVADGKNAAYKIINTIKYHQLESQKEKPVITYDELLQKRAERKYSKLGKIALNRYENNAPEIPFTEKDIVEEAQRCLLCNELCNICVTVCPNKANYCYQTIDRTYNIPRISINNKQINILKGSDFKINQKYQIINIADFCNECGNCNTFCPTEGAPYINKPKFFLNAESFKNAPSGFILSKQKERKVLIYKNEGAFYSLCKTDEYFIYEDNEIRAFFDLNINFIKAEPLTEGNITKDFQILMHLLILIDAADNLY